MIRLGVLIFAISVGLSSAWPTMYFYSRQAIGTAVNVNNGLSGVSGFDHSKPTRFLIHGFGDSCKGIRIAKLKDSLVKNHDINMICVDWEKGAAMPWYWDAVDNTRIAGLQLAEFIIKNAIMPDKIHCIGHSLGAHLCGFAAKNYHRLTGSKFERISGLDPAGPWFYNNNANERLDKSDAHFVDCIHTDGMLGIQASHCHKDFYPNGGSNQPGCGITSIFDWFGRRRRSVDTMSVEEATYSVQNEEDDTKVVYKISFAKPDQRFLGIDFVTFVCCGSMRKAPNQLADLHQLHVIAIKGRCGCDPLYGCSPMALQANRNPMPGDFFLDTNSKNPFCKG